MNVLGPFPNFDPVSGPSQMLMATPVTAGATIIAVPTGPPPPHGHQHTVKHQPGHQPPVAQPGQQAPVFHPPHPHMLHWDQHHPGGQIIPLRQPCGPVYYNMPGSGGSASSSGLQSPASEGGSCMSESSSTSGDQDMSEASTGHSTQMMAGPGAKQVFWQPGPGYPQHMPPMVPGFPAHHVRNCFQVRHIHWRTGIQKCSYQKQLSQKYRAASLFVTWLEYNMIRPVAIAALKCILANI